jgi:hypothetical protein
MDEPDSWSGDDELAFPRKVVRCPKSQFKPNLSPTLRFNTAERQHCRTVSKTIKSEGKVETLPRF